MEWFNGDISSAVGAAKVSSCYLLVFVVGNDSSSHSRLKLLESCQELKNKKYVGMRIKTDSNGYSQLEAIYGRVDSSALLIIDGTKGIAILKFLKSADESNILQSLLSVLPDKTIEVNEPAPILESSIVRESDMPSTLSQIDGKEDKCNIPDTDNDPLSQNGSEVKINLRHQDGRSQVIMCHSGNTLEDVRVTAIDLFKLKCQFDLALPYPRRTFTRAEDSETLENLALGPAITILILPKESSLQPRLFSRGILFILAPLFNLFENLWRRLFPRAHIRETNTIKKFKSRAFKVSKDPDSRSKNYLIDLHQFTSFIHMLAYASHDNFGLSYKSRPTH